jgi:hypothetical protein
MGILIRSILSVATLVLSGVGISEMFDKFVKPKVPTYYPEPISPGFKPMKLIWLVVAFFIAKKILQFVGKKTKLSILK